MTFSLRRSSFWLRPVPTLEIKTSSILTLTYSTGVPPTLRTVSSPRVGGALATAQHQFGRAAVHEFANRDVLDVDFAPAGTPRRNGRSRCLSFPVTRRERRFLWCALIFGLAGNSVEFEKRVYCHKLLIYLFG